MAVPSYSILTLCLDRRPFIGTASSDLYLNVATTIRLYISLRKCAQQSRIEGKIRWTETRQWPIEIKKSIAFFLLSPFSRSTVTETRNQYLIRFYIVRPHTKKEKRQIHSITFIYNVMQCRSLRCLISTAALVPTIHQFITFVVNSSAFVVNSSAVKVRCGAVFVFVLGVFIPAMKLMLHLHTFSYYFDLFVRFCHFIRQFNVSIYGVRCNVDFHLNFSKYSFPHFRTFLQLYRFLSEAEYCLGLQLLLWEYHGIKANLTL